MDNGCHIASTELLHCVCGIQSKLQLVHDIGNSSQLVWRPITSETVFSIIFYKPLSRFRFCSNISHYLVCKIKTDIANTCLLLPCGCTRIELIYNKNFPSCVLTVTACEVHIHVCLEQRLTLSRSYLYPIASVKLPYRNFIIHRAVPIQVTIHYVHISQS